MFYPTTRLVTPVAIEVFSRQEAKQWARIDHAEEDTIVDWLIKSSWLYVERITNRAIPTQTREVFFNCFGGDLLIPNPPLAAITEFEWTDVAGVARTWTVSGGNLLSGSTIMAHVDAYREPAAIRLAYGQSWPTETLQTVNPIRVRYTCGQAANAIDEDLKHAMRLLMAHWYENRAAVVVGQISAIKSERVQLAFDALVQNHISHYV